MDVALEENLINSTFGNETYEVNYRPEDIVFDVICLVAMCADHAIFHIIYCNPRLHYAQNWILAHWAIADILFLCVVWVFFRLIYIGAPYYADYECMLWSTGLTLHILVLQFMLLAAVDWGIAAYFESFSKKLRRYFIIQIVFVWIFAVVASDITSWYCLERPSYLDFTDSMHYLSLVTIVIILQCCRIVQKCRKKPLQHSRLMRTLLTADIFLLFLAYSGFYFPKLFDLGMGFVCCTGNVNLAILYFMDKDFKACIKQTFLASDNIPQETDLVLSKPVKPLSVDRSTEIAVGNKQEISANGEQVQMHL